jgi:hypothetical protein
VTISIEELLAGAQARTLEVRVCARGDLVNRHAELVAELEEASNHGSIGGNAEVRRIAEEITKVEDEQEEHTAVLTLHSVSRRTWVDLLAEHAPRDIDRKRGLDYNAVTFPPAAVAACCDAISPTDAERLAETLPPAEWNKLWVAVQHLNLVETPHPKLPTVRSIAQASDGS